MIACEYFSYDRSIKVCMPYDDERQQGMRVSLNYPNADGYTCASFYSNDIVLHKTSNGQSAAVGH